MNDERPETDDRDPAEVVTNAVGRILALAQTWTLWNGQLRTVDDRAYTPHKAIRRVADHLIDHLAQVEARLAGEAPLPDRWHGSSITTAADMAPFGLEDVDEARSRLNRLAQIWVLRLRSLPTDELDRADGDAWTVREIAFHVAESVASCSRRALEAGLTAGEHPAPSAPGRNRTCDTRFRKPLLCPLSYEGPSRWVTIGTPAPPARTLPG